MSELPSWVLGVTDAAHSVVGAEAESEVTLKGSSSSNRQHVHGHRGHTDWVQAQARSAKTLQLLVGDEHVADLRSP